MDSTCLMILLIISGCVVEASSRSTMYHFLEGSTATIFFEHELKSGDATYSFAIFCLSQDSELYSSADGLKPESEGHYLVDTQREENTVTIRLTITALAQTDDYIVLDLKEDSNGEKTAVAYEADIRVIAPQSWAKCNISVSFNKDLGASKVQCEAAPETYGEGTLMCYQDGREAFVTSMSAIFWGSATATIHCCSGSGLGEDSCSEHDPVDSAENPKCRCNCPIKYRLSSNHTGEPAKLPACSCDDCIPSGGMGTRGSLLLVSTILLVSFFALLL